MHKGLAAGLLSVIVIGCGGSSAGPTAPTAGVPSQAPIVASAPPSAPPSAPSVGSPSPSAAASDAPRTPSKTDAPASDAPSQAPAAWRELADVASGPGAREDHTWTVATDESAAYLFGGRGADGPSAELWRFDLASDTWTMLTPSGESPSARFGHTAIWAPGIGLVIWSGQAGSDFFADLWAYDSVANAWRELPAEGSAPGARYGSCAAVAADGRMWISHGFTSSGRFSDTWAYDFSAGQWQDVTPADRVPVERCLHDCFVSPDGDLVLYGGQTTGAAALGDIWTYDVATNAWARGPDPAAPPRQLYALTQRENGTAFVWGGRSIDGAFLDDAWQISSATLELSRFEQAAGVPAGRSGATLISDASRGRLLLFGGLSEEGLLGDLWELADAV